LKLIAEKLGLQGNPLSTLRVEMEKDLGSATSPFFWIKDLK
jgi:hypothetical protein